MYIQILMGDNWEWSTGVQEIDGVYGFLTHPDFEEALDEGFVKIEDIHDIITNRDAEYLNKFKSIRFYYATEPEGFFSVYEYQLNPYALKIGFKKWFLAKKYLYNIHTIRNINSDELCILK